MPDEIDTAALRTLAFLAAAWILGVVLRMPRLRRWAAIGLVLAAVSLGLLWSMLGTPPWTDF